MKVIWKRGVTGLPILVDGVLDYSYYAALITKCGVSDTALRVTVVLDIGGSAGVTNFAAD